MSRFTSRSVFTLIVDAFVIALCLVRIPSQANRASTPFIPSVSNGRVQVGQILDADAAGALHEGDELLLFDGHRISTEHAAEFFADTHRSGDPIIVVARHGGEEFTATLYLVPAYSAFYIAVILFVGVVAWSVAVFVLLARPRNLTASVLHWALMSMGTSVAMGVGSSHEPSLLLFLARGVFYLAYMNVAVTFLLFTTLFPAPRQGSLVRRLILLYVPALCVVAAEAYFNFKAQLLGSPEAYETSRTLYTVFHVFIIAYFLLGIYSFIRSFIRTTDPVERKKLQWILWGLAIGPGPFLLLELVFEFFVPLSPIPEELTLGFLAFIPIAFAISFIRYHLLDVAIVINRTTVYAIVLGVVLAVYLCVVAASAFVVGSASPPAYAAGAVLVALLFEPVRTRVQRFVDRKFFRIRYDFRLAERRFLDLLKHCADTEHIARLLVENTVALIPLDRIGFFTVDEAGLRAHCMAHRGFSALETRDAPLQPEWLTARLDLPIAITERIEPGIPHEPANPALFRQWGISLAFPMETAGDTLLAFLVLGEKKSGSRFTSEDVDLLRNAVAQARMEIQRIALQQQLIEKQMEARQLAELNQLKSDFVSYVSHEFRTPLTSIRMFAELLGGNGRKRSPREKEYLRIIEGETERLDRMVTTVLDSARIDRGVKQYRFEQNDLCAIVDHVLETMAYQLRKEGFTTSVRRSKHMLPFMGDADAVGQAVVNLLSNSMKYSGTKKTLRIVLSGNTRYVSCAICDKGQGVSQEALPHLFEKFFRDPALSSKAEGVGLGLSVVKHTMDAHHGEVLVESVPGKGSTFTLLFPVHAPQSGEAETHSEIKDGHEDHPHH